MRNLLIISSIVLFLISSQEAIGAASFAVNDSTVQEVIQFTHKTLPTKQDLFFTKDESVIIKVENRRKKVRGKIEGFTKNGILINGEEILIKDIENIRKESATSFILSLFSGVSLALFLIGTLIISIAFKRTGDNLENANTLIDFLFYFSLFAILILLSGTLLIALAILLVAGLALGASASAARYSDNKFFNMSKWNARIVKKKLAKLSKTK